MPKITYKYSIFKVLYKLTHKINNFNIFKLFHKNYLIFI